MTAQLSDRIKKKQCHLYKIHVLTSDKVPKTQPKTADSD